MRVKLTVAYNGKSFYGLQVQPDEVTVMGTFYKVFERLGISSKLHASGRTDRGVHATGQVLHCDLPPHWEDIVKLHHTLNTHLPNSIRVKKVEMVDDNFHARYSAKRRVYRYILSEETPNPFESDFITFVKEPIDLDLINKAMQYFRGTHDFVFFKKSGGAESTNFVRTVYQSHAYRYRGKIILYFEANGYLRSQIRLMVGALLALNSGKLDITQLIAQIDAIKQYHTRLAPENGLYLAKITY